MKKKSDREEENNLKVGIKYVNILNVFHSNEGVSGK